MIAEPTTAIIEPSTPLAMADHREVVISVRNVGKMYRIYEKPQDRLKQMLFWRFGKSYGHEFWALRDVSFEVRKGETVGIIGRNGSGKSTLLQIIAGTLAATEGQVEVRGRVAALLELGSGFNPEFTGRENVFLNGSILGVSRSEMEARFDQIAAFAEIGEFIDQPVKTYSSGMVVRLAFAVASCVDPDVLIIDEALAVGDILFQTRCLDRIKTLSAQGTTVLFVTHDTGTFQNLCDYGYVLNKGVLFTEGRPALVAMQYYELMRESEHARQRIAVQSEYQATEQVEAELEQKLNEIRAKVDDGEYRFGTALAQIVDYRLLNHVGQETSSIEVDAQFQVVVRIAFYGQVDHLSVGIMFRNPQGQNLMGMHSYHEHRVVFGVRSEGDLIEISCKQEMLLNPGDYTLHLSLADCRSDYDFTSLDSRNNLTKVTVFGKAISYGLVHTQPQFQSYTVRLDYSLEQIREIYERVFQEPHLAGVVQEILAHDEAPPEDGDPFEKEERSWPGEPRFVQSGYYRRMLGRYAFAGSEFCRGAQVLETCSGLGWGAYISAQFAKHVTAFDIDTTAVTQAEAMWPSTNINWMSGNACDLSFLGEAQFDVALGMESIEHLSREDGERYIAEVARHIRPGGYFIGTSAFPETEEEAEIIRRPNPFHLHIYTCREITTILQRYFHSVTVIGNWLFIAVR